MARADSTAFPFLMNEPVLGRIGEIFAESLQRAADDEFRGAKNRGALEGTQFVDSLRWQNFCPPQDFVGHPITDSRKTALHQQDGFDRCFTMPI